MLFAFLLATVLAAPDPMQELLALDLRVARIGDRLARAGGCDGVLSAPGWIVQDAAQYPVKLRADARRSLGLGDLPTVVALLPDGAAARAGVRVGDQIAGVGALRIEPSRGYGPVGAIEDAVEAGLRERRVLLAVRRDDRPLTIAVEAQRGCPSRFQLLPGKKLNAEADGRYVQVSGALAEFAASDDELALVIAHELAHNILQHRKLLKIRELRTRQAELEADDKALRLMAAAGYDPEVAPVFWRRLAAELLPDWLRDGSHPGTRERIERARATIERIRARPPAPR